MGARQNTAWCEGSPYAPAMIRSVELVVGMEAHVELATRSKMFSRVASPAHPEVYAKRSLDSRHRVPVHQGPEPNTLIDPVVLALPGALPVMNLAAVELSIMVGLALGCSIAPLSKWDRKSYFYPDLPKNYQISQYGLPLCFDGSVTLPLDGEQARTIGIIRAHLEEDAGKLLHELPGGGGGSARGGNESHSYADYNRAGTPLLEIVTQPDFRTADECVAFSQMLRNICRFLGASEGVMQRGHMRFEPNINCILTLDDGRTVRTPIVEVKNLNSFKSLRGAIEHELREQPRRWEETGIEYAGGTKTTRGWDDVRMETFVQREKEEAHDYRYFPDPDLPPVVVSEEWRDRLAARVPELPQSRARRFVTDYGLSPKEAAALTDERDDCLFFEAIVGGAAERGIERSRAGRAAANFVLQSGLKRVNERVRAMRVADGERNTALESDATETEKSPALESDATQTEKSPALESDATQTEKSPALESDATQTEKSPALESGATNESEVLVSALGILPAQVASIIVLREAGKLSAAAADELFGLLCGAEPVAPGFVYETAGRGGSEPPGADAADIATARGMLMVHDAGALEAWCDQAIAAEPASVQAFREGKGAAMGRLVGTAMKLAGGKADATAVRERLEQKLG